MANPLIFIAGRGTSFEIIGPDVVVDRDDTPATRIPFVDLLEFAKNHPLRAKPELPPGCNEFLLPAGSAVKIGGIPYQLKAETLVVGAMPPATFPIDNKSDQSELSTAQNTTVLRARQ